MRQFHLPPCAVVSCADGAPFPGARKSVSPVSGQQRCSIVKLRLPAFPKRGEFETSAGETTKAN